MRNYDGPLIINCKQKVRTQRRHLDLIQQLNTNSRESYARPFRRMIEKSKLYLKDCVLNLFSSEIRDCLRSLFGKLCSTTDKSIGALWNNCLYVWVCSRCPS